MDWPKKNPSRSSHVIEGAPTYYRQSRSGQPEEEGAKLTATNTPGVIEAAPVLHAARPSSRPVSSQPNPRPSTAQGQRSHPPTLMSMALPTDLEKMEAKKLAEKAHDTSYLGQVMRGEKKMKRFRRRAGGEMWEDPSLAEWDPNDFRIFCGDLGKEVSDEVLARAFRDYPSFQRARVVRDSRSNKSKGYGFVSFKDAEDYVRAFREMDGTYVGSRPIKLRKSQWKDRNLNVVKKKQKEKKRLGLV